MRTTERNNLYTAPSSILHNSTDVRAEYTRAAARQAGNAIRKNLKQMRAKLAWHNSAQPHS
ncbi:MAG: hypothetical protein KGY54_08235 [Oleiphilaceae bacterium]|nr:hypothetical protein [Oleiphilaceae bacterium]